MDHTWIIRVVPEMPSCDSSLERKHFLFRRMSSNDSESSKWGIIVDLRGLACRWAEILISDFQALNPTSGAYWIASSIWVTLDANRSPESGRPKSESRSPPERDVIAYETRSTNVMHNPNNPAYTSLYIYKYYIALYICTIRMHSFTHREKQVIT